MSFPLDMSAAFYNTEEEREQFRKKNFVGESYSNENIIIVKNQQRHKNLFIEEIIDKENHPFHGKIKT